MKGNRSQRRSATNVRDLLTRGRAAAKAGDVDEARFYLEWVLRTDAAAGERMEAWLWLSEISEDADKKREYLTQILAENPNHARARRSLALLDGRLRAEEVVDPERLPASPRERAAKGERFTCPQCAARLVFAPDGMSLQCEHCGYEAGAGRGHDVAEQDFIVTMATAKGHRKPEAMQAFACDSCAATFLLAPETLSLTCPYCDAAYSVVETETRQLVPPHAIIPFALDADEAASRLRRWLAQRKLPVYRDLHGFYLPAWTFDIGGALTWQQVRVDADALNLSSRVYTADGSQPLLVDDFVTPACRTLPPSLAGIVRTFNLDELLPFTTSYLAAWPAQTYEVAVGDASLAARSAVFKAEATRLRRENRELADARFSSAEIVVESYKLILLPLWLGHYRTGEKVLTVAVNGQSGAVRGETPRRGVGGLGRWLRDLIDG